MDDSVDLVVKDGADRRLTATRIYRHLRGVDKAGDAIIVTPTDMDRYRVTLALIIKPVLREGRAYDLLPSKMPDDIVL